METNKNYKQFLVGIIANLSTFAISTTIGWTSPVIPKLEDKTLKDSPLSVPINSEEAGWISSILTLSALFASFAAGESAKRIGRKWTLMMTSIFGAIPYILMEFANEIWIFYLARCIQGIGLGIVMTVVPMYIGEISTDTCRGILGTFLQLFFNSGILYVYIIGPFVSYKTLQWLCMILSIIFVCTFFFMPESPYYYMQKGRKDDAIKSLKFLRSKSENDVNDEITQIQTNIENAERNKGTIKDIFTNKGNLKAFIICSGLMAFQQLTGMTAVMVNSQSVYTAAGSDLDPAIATILNGSVQTISGCIAPLVVARFGRKIILLVSAIVIAIDLLILGAFFYLKSIGEDVSTLGWLPVTLLIIFVFVYCISFGALPMAILGEMFPPNIKSQAASIVIAIACFIGFLILRFFPTLNDLGPHISFWLFGTFCAIAFVFVQFFVIETKNLSLQQIQEKLNS